MIWLTQVKKPDDVPDGPHFALLVYSRASVHIPGDERSRTNPGHGYPEHTETYNTFTHYIARTIAELEPVLLELEQSHDKPPYVVLKVEGRLKAALRVSVEIGNEAR